ncbi:MAG TPA: DUF5615 family PIN-like protein [Blastocatellia bacterium]|jgi:hypothetical protein|nr:DUF5615 family PIN-like protein [Blastocatellia bacterium]
MRLPDCGPLFGGRELSLSGTEELRRLGHDVATMADLQKANQAISDEEVLSIAANQTRTILSHNRRDFIRLHNTSLPATAGSLFARSIPTFFARPAESMQQPRVIWREN